MTKAHSGNQSDQLDATAVKINEALREYSDKDWNYSRILLVMKKLGSLESPYILGLEILDLNAKQGRTDLKTLSDEVKWGERHSSELGMLEVVSLRLNKALLEITNDNHWQLKRPVVRIVKMEDSASESDGYALWYQISEVAGEDFDNR